MPPFSAVKQARLQGECKADFFGEKRRIFRGKRGESEAPFLPFFQGVFWPVLAWKKRLPTGQKSPAFVA